MQIDDVANFSRCSKTGCDMFSDIADFISKASIGPATVYFADSGNVRCGIIRPYNHHIINTNDSLYILLTTSRIMGNGGYNSIQFTSSKMNYSNIDVSFDQVVKLISKNFSKMVLFNDVRAYTIKQMLDRCIELGVFTIK